MEERYASLDGIASEMLQKPTAFPSFLGRRSYQPRPVSTATDFFDLDNDSDTESSPVSLDNGSESTVSSVSPQTPHSAGLTGFEFHFDDKSAVEPHEPQILSSNRQSYDEPKVEVPELQPTAKPQVGRPVTALNQAVAELDEAQVRSWRPDQVADWMSRAGFEAGVIDKFLFHDISGSVLIDLQFEDLKELDISSFGKRHRVMSSIQQLRSSVLIPETQLSRTSSRSTPPARSSRALTLSVAPEERHVVAESRSRSRRRRRKVNDSAEVTPAESVSIVAIEQLLPKPHSCSKGEECPKWKKYQKKIQRIHDEFSAEIEIIQSEEQKSEFMPSIIGSSDILGPTPPVKITADRLNEVQTRDAQDNVRQFLSFQHVHNASLHGPSPPPSTSVRSMSDTLRDLPRLTIPEEVGSTLHPSPTRTPFTEFACPTEQQTKLRHLLRNDPYHYGGVASPADIYRVDTPMSASDIPDTMHPQDPICERIIAQSVPPEMRYGGPSLWTTSGEPITRSRSTAPIHRRPSTIKPPTIPSLKEDLISPSRATFQPGNPHPSHVSTDVLAHSGWMRKRRTNRTIRTNEWSDNYFRLSGSRLLMLDSDHPADRDDVKECIDVDQYAVHAYNVATSSKLSAAFKKSILGSGYMASEPRFAFSLVPEMDRERGKKLFKDDKSRAHHFAVRSGGEKVEWMRRLMLAKAASRNGSGANKI